METLFTPRERSEFSLSRALRDASTESLNGTLEGEMLMEASTRAGKGYTPNAFYLPFELLQHRDLTAAGVSGSNYLVGTTTPFALDVLRPASNILRAGAQVIQGQDSIALPRVSTPSTPYWLSNEETSITPSQGVIGALSMTPKNLATLTTVSHQLTRQTNLDAFLRRELVNSMGTALDSAVLAGTGVNGEPLGIHATPGIDTQSGTSLDWAGLLAMLEAVTTGNASGVTFIGTPGVRTLLANRARLSGGSTPIWNDGRIESFEAVALSNAPSATLTCGDFSQIVMAVFGDGLSIEVNPGTGFTSGKLSYRAWMTCDIAVATPSAFSVATGVS